MKDLFNLWILSSLLIVILTDDPNRLPTKCEVCKLLAQELTENLQEHNSPMVIETGYSLDEKQARKTKYADSYVLDFFKIEFDRSKIFSRETRLIETLENVCERFLHYNVHAERSGSLRYARGRSQTMDTLWNLRFDLYSSQLIFPKKRKFSLLEIKVLKLFSMFLIICGMHHQLK